MAKHSKKYDVLNSIIEYHKEHGYAPSQREIGQMCNMTSSSSVNNHILRLIDEGYLASEHESSPRAIRLNGQWIDRSYGNKLIYSCNLCDKDLFTLYPSTFCPNCGAKMKL